MLEAAPTISDLDAQIVVVGNGAVHFLKDFAASYSDELVFLTDPELRAYKALSLQRGLGGLQAFGMVTSGLRAYRAGHRQAKTQGDVSQLGGVFVVARGGAVIFEHRSKTADDHPEMDAVLAALASHRPK